MNPEYPKLRSDLLVVRQDAAGPVVFVMKDPVSGRFFRFKESEGFILEHLDGTISLEIIRDRFQQKFDSDLPLDTLKGFVVSLRSLGFLEGTTVAGAHKRSSRRIRGDPFYLRIKIFDPDALFEKLIRKLNFFFTRSFLVASAVSILVALFITVTSWIDIQHDIYGLFQFFSLLTAWCVVLVVITGHEFAHGLMCKRFGGQVHEIGFILLYFMPGFYCDVSDAWLFPEKSKRLWVTFAGGYFEIFIWSVSTIIWRLTEPMSPINSAALVVMATSGIKTLFNFNPLIKLDGYYMLSDYLEIPNLRGRAVGYLKNLLSAPFNSARRRIRDITARERKIYIIYGLLAAAFSYWLITSIVLHLGEFLMSRYRGWGFALLLLFFAGLFRSRLAALFRKPISWLGALWRNRSPLGKIIRVGPVLALLAALLFMVRLPLTVSGESTILPIHNSDIRAEVEEIITDVFVGEGDTVQKGDLIVQLSDRALKAELQEKKSEMETIEAKLSLLRAGPRPEEVSLADTRVAKAKERLSFAEKDLERNRALFDQALLPQSEYERSQELVSIRVKELEEEQSALDILLAGSRREEVEALESEYQAVGAQEKYLESQLQLLSVRSPSTGVIASPKLKERIGQHVEVGDLIAEVHELRTVTVEILVSEKDIADVMIGLPVVLKARAYPRLSFRGSVASIAPIATRVDEWKQDRVIVVRAHLDNSQLQLKSGMSGNAKIYCDRRTLFNLLMRRILHFVRVEVWSWW